MRAARPGCVSTATGMGQRRGVIRSPACIDFPLHPGRLLAVSNLDTRTSGYGLSDLFLDSHANTEKHEPVAG
jgi:hypothetical protein